MRRAGRAARRRPALSPRWRWLFDDIVAAYGSIQALHGVSISVAKGEVVAVLGANGAGKTTLLNTISGLVRPSERHRHLSGRGHHRHTG